MDDAEFRPFASRLLDWYDRAKRDLPWRAAGPGALPDAYRVLVSELMLQQTQVATVIPYFRRFLERFPTANELAAASEQDVLRLWQGLGYYSRARNLQKAAQAIVTKHGGTVPADVETLLALPGVGRYTAGAIASIAFGVRAPILDGNVMRVLCRIWNIPDDPRERDTTALLWTLAERILPDDRVGDFNSAMMELGATVCIPRSPQCLICPVAAMCRARAAGTQDQIPPAKKTKPTPLEKRVVMCIRRGDEWLIEQRPSTGRWAGMWQFITRPAPAKGKPIDWPVPTGRSTKVGVVEHALTHRRYRFDVRRCDVIETPSAECQTPNENATAWVTLADLSAYPLPKPHLRIAEMLR